MQFKFKKTLLIDDNRIDNLINKKILQNNQFAQDIEVFDSARLALIHLQQSVADFEDLPDVIFLDIKMPEMDGFEFLEEFEKLIENISEKCQVLMLSSSMDPYDTKRANENLTVKSLLNKPLSNNILSNLQFNA